MTLVLLALLALVLGLAAVAHRQEDVWDAIPFPYVLLSVVVLILVMLLALRMLGRI